MAQAVIDNLDCPYVAKAEIAGPGLLILSETKLDSRTLASIVAARGADYGNLPARGGEKIQLEYERQSYRTAACRPWPWCLCGDSSLANLLKAAGYDVTQNTISMMPAIRSIIWSLRSMPVIWKSLVWMSSRKTVIMVTTL